MPWTEDENGREAEAKRVPRSGRPLLRVSLTPNSTCGPPGARAGSSSRRRAGGRAPGLSAVPRHPHPGLLTRRPPTPSLLPLLGRCQAEDGTSDLGTGRGWQRAHAQAGAPRSLCPFLWCQCLGRQGCTRPPPLFAPFSQEPRGPVPPYKTQTSEDRVQGGGWARAGRQREV